MPFSWGSKLSGVPDEADVAWYARTVRVPQEWAGQRVFLVVGASDWKTSAWLDGQALGEYQGGYTPFAFDVSPLLNYGADNVVVFRVDAMPWRVRFDIIPNWFATDWMHYVGVVQDVYLEAAPPTHIVRVDASGPKASARPEATHEPSNELQPEYPCTVSLVNPTVSGRSAGASVEMTASRPGQWIATTAHWPSRSSAPWATNDSTTDSSPLSSSSLPSSGP